MFWDIFNFVLGTLLVSLVGWLVYQSALIPKADYDDEQNG